MSHIPSSPKGSYAWAMQRMTAIILALFIIISLIYFVRAGSLSSQTFLEALRHPPMAAASTLALVSMFYHSFLGLVVIVEDYVHCKVMERGSVILLALLHLFFAIFGVYLIFTL